MAANLIVHGMDITAMRAGMRTDFDALKAALDGDEEASPWRLSTSSDP